MAEHDDAPLIELPPDPRDTSSHPYWIAMRDRMRLVDPGPQSELLVVEPRAAAPWPARTWTPAERVSAGMMNTLRDELNELHGQVSSMGGVAALTTWAAGADVVSTVQAPVQIVFCTNTALLTLNSFTAPGAQPGDRLIIMALGTGGTIGLTYGSGVNLFANTVRTGPSMLVGTAGVATYVRGSGGGWRMVSHVQGGYLPYTATFGVVSGGGVWTVGTQGMAYLLTGNLLSVSVWAQGSTIGTCGSLSIALPLGYQSGGLSAPMQAIRASLAGNVVWGLCQPGAGILNLWSGPAGSGWGPGADNNVYFQGLVAAGIT